jgi:hypothetical protein
MTMSTGNDRLETPGASAHNTPAAGRMSPAEMRAEINQKVARQPVVQDRRKTPRPPKNVRWGRGFLARLFSRKSVETTETRRGCCIVGVLMVLDRALALDGLVLELGNRTAVFRQGSSFIFDRTGAEISLRFGEHDRRGRITEVNARGYVIEWSEEMRPSELGEILEQFGIPD